MGIATAAASGFLWINGKITSDPHSISPSFGSLRLGVGASGKAAYLYFKEGDVISGFDIPAWSLLLGSLPFFLGFFWHRSARRGEARKGRLKRVASTL
jgi:hypothetical protein